MRGAQFEHRTTATATKTARSAASTANTMVSTLRKIYGPSFATGEADAAKLSDVLEKLHDTSLTQLVKDHGDGKLENKVRQAARLIQLNAR